MDQTTQQRITTPPRTTSPQFLRKSSKREKQRRHPAQTDGDEASARERDDQALLTQTEIGPLRRGTRSLRDAKAALVPTHAKAEKRRRFQASQAKASGDGI